MRNSVRYLTVLVAVLALSSALFASPNANSSNCPAGAKSDTAIWGIGTSSHGPISGKTTPCSPTQTTISMSEAHAQGARGLGYVLGKLAHGIGISFDTAIWGFTPPPPK